MPGGEKADATPSAPAATGDDARDELAKLREQMADIQKKLDTISR